ncbi:glycosyltransferase [Dysgonomonas sp. 521]|uniref:glycosyltransferase n=1 Tax=Dysgonomonas sp. 521 TaxID=2302932 RepID=UPI0013D3867E|nr:glycosyltransferase [Dysgonomonas sp. 521]NDV94647.1 glycosyltransferase [Dysgonomonas sp. 521]
MRIAILSPFHPYRGGIAQFSEQLSIELMRQNEVQVFSFTKMYPDFLFPGKTQYVPEGESSDIDVNRILNSINPFSYIQTAKEINRYKPDVVVIAYWMSFMVPAFSSVCLLLDKKIKIIALIHNAIPHEKRVIDKPLAKFFFNRCDGFIVLSEPVREDLLSLKKDAKVILHPHPIYNHYGEPIDRNTACENLGIREDKKNLLFFGLIREYKGLDILIEAMKSLDDSYQLIIAGESYDGFSKYSEQIEKLPYKENVSVHEQYIPDKMVSTFFSAADVLVLPYRSATQSGVVTIAYQMETPMIATNVGALGTSVETSQTGLVVASVSAEDISNGIKKFFSENGQINIYKENLKKEKDLLSWSNFVKSVNPFLSSL